jgi:hypothetical protein
MKSPDFVAIFVLIFLILVMLSCGEIEITQVEVRKKAELQECETSQGKTEQLQKCETPQSKTAVGMKVADNLYFDLQKGQVEYGIQVGENFYYHSKSGQIKYHIPLDDDESFDLFVGFGD